MTNQLTGELYEKLVEALLDAFPAKVKLAQMVHFELNENLDTIAGGEDLKDIVFNLIKEINRQGRLEELIRAARKANPKNPKLISLSKEKSKGASLYENIYIAEERNNKSPVPLKLTDDKFKFLYFVYVKSETDIYSRVNIHEIQELLGISQQKASSVGCSLDRKGLIRFKSWAEGIWIVHMGIVLVEDELLNVNMCPTYVSDNEILKAQKRMNLRLKMLQHIYQEVVEDTSKRIWNTDLAEYLEIGHRCLINRILPYMDDKGWIYMPNIDQITITEDGIDRVKTQFT